MAKKKKEQIAAEDAGQEKQRLIQYILRCVKEAEDASIERRSAWKELWLLYQSKQDYSKKQSWQSKCFSPKIFMQVERAAALVKRALLQTRKLFKLNMDENPELSESEADKLREEVSEVERKFKRRLAKSNLTNIYSEMAKSAFLLGLGVPKVLWDDENDTTTYENVPILNLRIAPSYKPSQKKPPKYIIEYKEMTLAELRAMVDHVNKSAGSEIFDTAEVDKIEEDFTKLEQDHQRRKSMGVGQYSHVDKRVGIWEFWGSVISKDGKDIEENRLMMLANDKYLIRNQENGYNHKKPPYILTVPLTYPHRGFAGISLVEPMAKLQYAFNNILNLFMDNLNFSVNKMFEYNPTSLQNPKAILTIWPGKTIAKTVDTPVLQEVMTTNVAKDAVYGLDVLSREMQEGTAVTEFLMGMPGKKAKTLGEVEIKTSESQGLFDIIARDLEENSLKPLLEMSYDLMVQFSDFEDRKDKYQINVDGLSLILMQQKQIQQISQILVMALKSPDLKPRTDIGDLWQRLLGIYNLSDVYIEPEEAEQQAGQPEGQMMVSPEQIAMAEEQGRRDAHAALAGLV